jgi:hypothetical protein
MATAAPKKTAKTQVLKKHGVFKSGIPAMNVKLFLVG